MKRGEIYYADLEPTIGSETRKKRPVVIVSNNANNNVATTITVLPLTSNVKKIYPFEVLLEKKFSGLSKDSKVQCHQIRTISKLRLSTIRPVGMINKEIIDKIITALKLHLDMG